MKEPATITGLNYLQDKFRMAVENWFHDLDKKNIYLHITETLRTFERSDYLYKKGRTIPGTKKVTNSKSGESYHNYGFAIDSYPIVNHRLIIDFDKDKDAMQVMRQAAALATSYGIHWGIAPPGKLVKDLPHFQWALVPPIRICQQIWPKGFLQF